MGNTSSINKNISANKEFKNFSEVMDYIASHYILSMDFKSLTKLSDKEYCQKMVILTSDIIEKHFNDNEIKYLSQRIKDNKEVNEMKTEKVSYIDKDKIDTLDISNDFNKSIKKKRVCIGIAKFYIKIAHIFSAIIMTVNPVYTYKDANGNVQKTGLLEKDKIPKGTKKYLAKINICDERIKALKQGEKKMENGDIIMQPNVCDINMKNLNEETYLVGESVTEEEEPFQKEPEFKEPFVKQEFFGGGFSNPEKTLEDEPGITELMKLYFDDIYDYSTGTFNGMSEKTKTQYLTDLKLFYTAFTGNDIMPPEIQKFSDIKLRDYSKKPGCQGNNPLFKQKYTVNSNDSLFINYAENIKKMIDRAASNQYKLLDVINELFSYVLDPYTNKRVIRINPKLNEETLQKAVEKTRKLIIDLYITCEKDYLNGIKIYEAIVESKILETTKMQIQNLEESKDKILDNIEKTNEPDKIDPSTQIVNQEPLINQGPLINQEFENPEPQKEMENLNYEGKREVPYGGKRKLKTNKRKHKKNKKTVRFYNV
jgi:hypothetical protein